MDKFNQVKADWVEIYLLSTNVLKYSFIICTSQTREILGNDDLKLNDPLKYIVTDER